MIIKFRKKKLMGVYIAKAQQKMLSSNRRNRKTQTLVWLKDFSKFLGLVKLLFDLFGLTFYLLQISLAILSVSCFWTKKKVLLVLTLKLRKILKVYFNVSSDSFLVLTQQQLMIPLSLSIYYQLIKVVNRVMISACSSKLKLTSNVFGCI